MPQVDGNGKNRGQTRWDGKGGASFSALGDSRSRRGEEAESRASLGVPGFALQLFWRACVSDH